MTEEEEEEEVAQIGAPPRQTAAPPRRVKLHLFGDATERYELGFGKFCFVFKSIPLSGL